MPPCPWIVNAHVLNTAPRHLEIRKGSSQIPIYDASLLNPRYGSHFEY
jgi:hypothetical protein